MILRYLNIIKTILVIYIVSISSLIPVIASPNSVKIDTLLYSSFRHNNNTVGQQLTISISKNIKVITDFESYLHKYVTGSFVPSMINFGLQLEYKNIGWKHSCLHDIDKYVAIAYPRKNEFFIQW